jgi:DNA mismatch repair protein MutL
VATYEVQRDNFVRGSQHASKARVNEGTVKILPEHLANQIAAGEVVQRPESVVKELVENSLDAGATSVSVIVREAGKQFIHVIDDGKGMVRSDLELAPVRHATSKISSANDLHSIRTLGFRGEALASIAAVADLEIRTRRDGHEGGHTLVVRPGGMPTITDAHWDTGTQIIVRNLFYNVPARRKFLKADLTEFRYISETMQKLALARPDVRFTFHDGDTLVFDVRPTELRHRIRDILAIDSSKSLISVELTEDPYHVEGFVGRPSISRQSRSGQFLYLNGRPIVNRSLAHAVASAYEHLLESGQHPVFVLHLTVDPHRVDVNVHPQKHEVKFDDERSVYLLLQRAIATALQGADVIPAFLTDADLARRPLQSLPSDGRGAPLFVNRLTGEIQQPHAPASSSGPMSAPRSLSGTQRSAVDALFSRGEQEVTSLLHAGLQYIVTTSSEGLVVIDQHAAHERILFERALKRHQNVAQTGQALLFAVEVRLSPSHVSILKEYEPEISALGFKLDLLDQGKVVIHAVPSDVQPGSEDGVLGSMIDALESAGRLPRDRRHEGVAAVFASRQAVRRGETLSMEELRAIVKDLFACSVPHVTANGEPTYFVIPFDELVHRFQTS